jgi:hypothetical protein
LLSQSQSLSLSTVRHLHYTGRNGRTGLVTTLVGKHTSPAFLVDLRQFLLDGNQRITKEFEEVAKMAADFQSQQQEGGGGKSLGPKEGANDW